MKLAEAAETYRRLRPELDAIRAQLGEAEDVLKTHFRRPRSKAFYEGVGYEVSSFKALDIKLAREALGKQAEQCEVTRRRERLIILESEQQAA